MKQKRLFVAALCTLLLLPGCGTESNSTTGSTNIQPSIDETTTEYDEEFFLELIPQIPTEILGLCWDLESRGMSVKNTPDIFYLYMSNPIIIELETDYIIAEGMLSNEWHSTKETVVIKYNRSGGIINSGFAVSEDVVWLTPAIPFSTDCLYNLIDYVYIRDTKTTIEFTPETFPIIELDDIYWDDNYSYSGIATLTDAEGNIYQSTIPENGPDSVVIHYTSASGKEEWYWESAHESIHVNKVE